MKRKRSRRPTKRRGQGWNVRLLPSDEDPAVLIDGQRVTATKVRGLAETLLLMAEAMENPGDTDRAAMQSAAKRLARFGTTVSIDELEALDPGFVSKLCLSFECRDRTKKALAVLIDAMRAEQRVLDGFAHPDWANMLGHGIEVIETLDQTLPPPGTTLIPDRGSAMPEPIRELVEAISAGASDEEIDEILGSDALQQHFDDNPIFGVDSGPELIPTGHEARIYVSPRKNMRITRITASLQTFNTWKSLTIGACHKPDDLHVGDPHPLTLRARPLPLAQFQHRNETAIFYMLPPFELFADEDLVAVVRVKEPARTTFTVVGQPLSVLEADIGNETN